MIFLRKNNFIIVAIGCLALFLASVQASIAEQCQVNNEALQAMDEAYVQFSFADGSELEFQVKLASNPVTRAAGFQRVCEATIAAEPILFVFENEVLPNFHMNNVVAPIDIAFIDMAGSIDSIHAMQTYILGSKRRPLYSPHHPVIAALEVHPGFYAEHKIDQSVKVSWRTSAD